MGYTDDYKYKIIDVCINEADTFFYTLIEVEKPYKYRVRLKPFITSWGRIQTARVALENLDSVIRIHTDDVVYDKQITTDLPNFLTDKKTTGFIRFDNVNNYHKLT